MNSFSYPEMWSLLTDSDKQGYLYLRVALQQTSHKAQRNKRITNFQESLRTIQSFCIRHNEGDIIRSFACGIVWLNDFLAINTHQLKLLLGKCKSSINGSLQKLGYLPDINRTDAVSKMQSSFPYLKDNLSELRKWTFRSARGVLTNYELESPRPVMIREEPKKVFEIYLNGLAKPIHYKEISVNVLEDDVFPEWNDSLEFPFSWESTPNF